MDGQDWILLALGAFLGYYVVAHYGAAGRPA